MSCKECDAAQDSDLVAPYRWKTATVILVGCNKHLREIIDVLNQVQAKERP